MNNDKLTELIDALEKARQERNKALSIPDLYELGDWRESYWALIGKDFFFSKDRLFFEDGKIVKTKRVHSLSMVNLNFKCDDFTIITFVDEQFECCEYYTIVLDNSRCQTP